MPLNFLHIPDDPIDSELAVIDAIASNFLEEVFSNLASNDETDFLGETLRPAWPEAESR
jgi:hypothetical protein